MTEPQRAPRARRPAGGGMSAADHYEVDELLTDLMMLGSMAANFALERDDLPAVWLGLFGRLTERLAREAQATMGNLPDLD